MFNMDMSWIIHVCNDADDDNDYDHVMMIKMIMYDDAEYNDDLVLMLMQFTQWAAVIHQPISQVGNDFVQRVPPRSVMMMMIVMVVDIMVIIMIMF